MLPLYKDLAALDLAATTKYNISQEILMENAARGVYEFLKEHALENKKILIVTGGGNNGADGLALARMLPNAFIMTAAEPKSELCKLQLERAKKLGIPSAATIDGFEIIIDAILGSGISKPLDGEIKALIEKLNQEKSIKISIDIPSGVRDGMSACESAFIADFTLTMGAHKTALYQDYAKDFVGKIVLKNLGLDLQKYTDGFKPDGYVLDEGDVILPSRAKKSCHKGDFGHLSIISGEMIGASVIAAKAAVRSGIGLVTITERDMMLISEPQIMLSVQPPKGANTILVGQGLGGSYSDDEIISFISTVQRVVIDADIFKKECVKDILAMDKKIVLTPHPKEFCSLWEKCMGEELTVETLQKDRFGYAQKFTAIYKDKTLVLKGSNTIIAENGELYVMSLGSASLAKGGSGDALAGAIASLLAQGYEPLEAAKNGSLMIALSAANYKGTNYSLTIEDLLEGLKWL